MFQVKRLKSLYQFRMMIGILVLLFLILNNAYCIEKDAALIESIGIYQTMHGMIVTPPTNGGLLMLGRLNGEKYVSVQYDINLDLNCNYLMITPNVQVIPSYESMFSTADDDSSLRNILGFSGFFMGSYDFRVFDMYSQPIIAKKQNPQAELYVDGVYPNGFLKYHAGIGVAHESNGQFVETLNDFQHMREINNSLYNQAFASMGSNYLTLRGAYAITNWKNTIKQNVLCFEYRLYFPDISDDLNITDIEIPDGGLRAYDGIRFGVDHYEMGSSCTRMRVILPTNFTNDYCGKGDYIFLLRSGLEISWFSLDRAWPIFYTVKLGSSASLAYYFVPSASIAFGITLPTSISINQLSSDIKARLENID